MLDLSLKNKSFFAVKIGGKQLEVEPPKIKTIRKMIEVSEQVKGDAQEITADQLEDLLEIVVLILSKNRKKVAVDRDFIEDNLDYEAVSLLLQKYFEWIGEIQKSPN